MAHSMILGGFVPFFILCLNISCWYMCLYHDQSTVLVLSLQEA